MTLEQVANIGEILGAGGVIASLVFVGWQIRTNTRTARLRMHEQVTHTYMSLIDSILMDPDTFAAGVKSSDDDFAEMSDGQKLFFFGTMLGLFKHFELMYTQHSQGVMDRETWLAWSQHIRMYFHQPGVQAWWRQRKPTFVPGFQAFLEASQPAEMRSFADLVSTDKVL